MFVRSLCAGLLCLVLAGSGQAQYFTAPPTLDGDCSDPGYVGDGPWHMGWDDAYLYLCYTGGATDEPVILYLDTNPLPIVSGGGDADGSLTGQTNWGITPTLPFRSDFMIYWESGYAEYRRSNGSGGWTAQTVIGTGDRSSTGNTNREIRLSWAGMMGLSGRPGAFNWAGYANSRATPGFIYNQRPGNNPDGAQSTPTFQYYFTVSATGSGSPTNPFARRSYGTSSNHTLASGEYFDVTLRALGTMSGTTVNNRLVIGAGGAVAGATTYAAGSVLVYDTGGSYNAGSEWATGSNLAAAGVPFNVQLASTNVSFASSSSVRSVRGTLTVPSGRTLTLSSASGGDLALASDFALDGTLNPNGRAVFFVGGTEVTQTFSGSGTATSLPLVIKQNGSTVDLPANLTITERLQVDGGTVSWPVSSFGNTLRLSGTGQFSNGGAPLTLSGNIEVTGGTPSISASELTLSRGTAHSITGSGTLTLPATTKTGTGTLTLTAPIKTPNGFTVAQGQVNLGGTQNLEGPLTIEEDATLSIGTTVGAPALTVTDLTVDGTLSLGTNLGGDVALTGDLSVDGTWIANARAVFFRGSADQRVLAGSLSIPFFIVDKTAAENQVIVDADLSVDSQLILTTGTLSTEGDGIVRLTTRTSGDPEAVVRIGTITRGENGSIAPGSNVRYERRYTRQASGWRMISPPSNANYSTLSQAGFLTQGGQWATFSGGQPVLYRWDFATQQFQAVTGPDAAFDDQGYIFYMFHDETVGSTTYELPKTWAVTGDERGAFTRDLSGASGRTAFVRNPFMAYLSFASVHDASTGLEPNVWIWDPAITSGGGNNGFLTRNVETNVGDAGSRVAPFQSFLVRTSGANGSLVVNASAIDNSVVSLPPHVGRPEREEEPAANIQFVMSGANGLGSRAWAVFWENGSIGPDPGDARVMGSLDAQHASLWFRDLANRRLTMDARPLGTAQTMRLGVASTQPGTYTLSWPEWHAIPEAWSVTVIDDATGQTYDLRETEAITFTIGEAALVAGGPEANLELAFTSERASNASRFTLVVEPQGVPTEGPGDAVAFGLETVYPNPAADRATVVFALAEPGDARVTVFDVLGRAVLVPAEGAFGAGRHAVEVEAGALASGSYVIRLEAGGQVATQRLTVVR